MTELKPCPFCGTENPDLIGGGNNYLVRCHHCKASGAWSESEVYAESLWNTRVTTPETETTPTISKIDETCESLRKLLIAKNTNYGDSALNPPPFVPTLTTREALLVRLGDKFQRLQTLSKGEPDLVGESITDTVRDIAGYCVLILIESEK